MARIGVQPFSWFNGYFQFSKGDGIYYETNPYLGYRTFYELQATFKPVMKFSVYYSFENSSFFKSRAGENVYSINVISQRISYQFSKSMSLRLITDYNDYDGEIFNGLL